MIKRFFVLVGLCSWLALSACSAIGDGDTSAKIAFIGLAGKFVEQAPPAERAERAQRIVELADELQVMLDFNGVTVLELQTKGMERIAKSNLTALDKALAMELFNYFAVRIQQSQGDVLGDVVTEETRVTINNILRWARTGALLGAST